MAKRKPRLEKNVFKKIPKKVKGEGEGYAIEQLMKSMGIPNPKKVVEKKMKSELISRADKRMNEGVKKGSFLKRYTPEELKFLRENARKGAVVDARHNEEKENSLIK